MGRGQALEEQAEAQYRAVDYRGAIGLYEEAFRAYREDGESLGAYRAARILAWLNGNVYGDWAIHSGWIGRARTLLGEAGPDSAEHGWILMTQAAPDGDPLVQEPFVVEALELGRRHRDPDLEFEALGWLGLMMVHAGRVEEGLQLFDECSSPSAPGRSATST